MDEPQALRPLGRSGLSTPKLMFGGNVFGWTADAATSRRLLDRLRALDLFAIDTADVYSAWVPGHSGGESETAIGDWLAGSGGRERVLIATKVGMKMGSGETGLHPDRIARAAEDSLRRLRTDRIDLYQAHADDPSVPLAEMLGAFSRLIEQGKVRAIGASNYSAPRLREALAESERCGLPRFETLQPLYNMLERPAFEDELAAVCAEAGLGVIPYYSLASGFLTGKYRSEADLDRSPRGSRVGKYLEGRGPQVLAALDQVSQARGATMAQVALAWTMARPGITAPIASATSVAQLDEIAAAVHLSLSDKEMASLDRASAS